jgi:predicted short-subunit dehydrogenase-like oxidoreductase (DUF2520 family)
MARLAIGAGADVRIWSRRIAATTALPTELLPLIYTAAEPAASAEHDIVLLTVPDDVLARLVRQLSATSLDATNTVWLHTSGVTPVARLASLGSHIGSVHPLQSIESPDSPLANFERSVFAVAGEPVARAAAIAFAESAGAVALDVPDSARAAYHAAAVLAGNGVFALVEAAGQVVTSAGLDATVLEPALARLAEVSARNVASHGLGSAITGPVVRRDVSTLAAHRRALHDLHDVDALYVLLTRLLVDRVAGEGLPAHIEAAMRAVLEAAPD